MNQPHLPVETTDPPSGYPRNPETRDGDLSGPAAVITGEDYVNWMGVVSSTVRGIRLMPINELLATVRKAETLGPILDATAYWRGGGKTLDDQRDLLQALAEVQRVAERIAGPIGGERS